MDDRVSIPNFSIQHISKREYLNYLHKHVKPEWVDEIRYGLAFAVQSFGDKRFHVSNTLNIDAHAYFSFVYIACTPEYLFSLIDRVNEEGICAKEELYTRLELRLLKAL